VSESWYDGTNLYVVTEGTVEWGSAKVFYSTNLVVDTPEWSELSGVSSAGSSSVVTQWFAPSAISPTTYYRTQGQED
jgi:hypothetical protein